MDAANLFKPMLARGQLRCIGSTTLEEYRKYVEKDAAFERCFQQVYVAEPKVAGMGAAVGEGLEQQYGPLSRALGRNLKLLSQRWEQKRTQEAPPDRQGESSLIVSGGDEVNVNIRCSNGSKFSMRTRLESTVQEFKAVLAQSCDVPAEQQCLIYKVELERVYSIICLLESIGVQEIGICIILEIDYWILFNIWLLMLWLKWQNLINLDADEMGLIGEGRVGLRMMGSRSRSLGFCKRSSEQDSLAIVSFDENLGPNGISRVVEDDMGCDDSFHDQHMNGNGSERRCI
ncbi:unnamed protein product [Fraxinus pennsylvanica]|uniref:Ubiquitin-like domain-containing protein n=1 Tax=Fraxinus pennsylvanica TaxID=56036 RepID=A0AAD1YW00_9LAMI|nr:unnamed protein product [Fraxinus pennsylvanica]